MGLSPLEGPKLHDRDETPQVVHLCFLVVPVNHSWQVEQLGSLVHFSPETVFHHLFSLLENLVVLECIQVSENAHDPEEALAWSQTQFCWLFTTKDQCKKKCILLNRRTYVQSRFVSVQGPLSVVLCSSVLPRTSVPQNSRHTWLSPCFSEVHEATFN